MLPNRKQFGQPEAQPLSCAGLLLLIFDGKTESMENGMKLDVARIEFSR